MSLEIIQGFKVSKAEPVDTKLRLSKEEMLNIDENTMPAQYFCVCSDDGKMYTYNVNNSIDPETGKFRIVGGDTDKTEIVVSDTPPTLEEYPDSIIWVDTDEERVDIDEGFNSDIIDEFRTEIINLTMRVTTLEREIIALKEVISVGGGTVSPDDPDDPSS